MPSGKHFSDRFEETKKRIFEKLKKCEMSTIDISVEFHMARTTVVNYIRKLRDEGKIYVERYHSRGGNYTAYYRAGNKLDAKKIKPAFKQSKPKKIQPIYNFEPRMDISASWMKNPKC